MASLVGRLERLCRHGAPPAFARDRLAWTADDAIRIESYQAFEQHRIPSPTRDWTWTLGAVGDLTGDGHLELVWQNTDTLAVEAWRMIYSDYTGTLPLTPPSPLPKHPWRLVGPEVN